MTRKHNKRRPGFKLISVTMLFVFMSTGIVWGNNFDILAAQANRVGTQTLKTTGTESGKTLNAQDLGDFLGATVNQMIKALQPHTAAPATPVSFDISGTVEDGLFYSPILNRNEPYRIYMPPNYQISGERYPVLYMLHGLSGSYKEWTDYNLINTVDTLITQGKIPPILVMMPTGDQEYFVDHADGGLQWGAYLAYDVVHYTDATYRTIPDRASRGVGGLSMGGYGALQEAFNYPGVFGVVGAHSPALRTKEQAPAFLGDETFYEAHDPVSLAKSLPETTLDSLKIWIDIGNQDNDWLPRAQELDQVLTSRGIPHEFHVWPGIHGGEYWIANVSDYLQWYAANLAN